MQRLPKQAEDAAMREERRGEEQASPWSAGGRASLLCFSESERFPCPDRSALKREAERVLVS